MKKLIFPFLIVLVSLLFFRSYIFSGKLPIPSDTIVGLYHPFRDLLAKDYPRGVPFKNSLITDPVRQQYPWRFLVINGEKKMELPLWNPYSMAGYPLLANSQSSPWYPLNLLFFVLSFQDAWSILIMLQPILAGIFLYYYLDHMKLHRMASFLGAIVFSFCGFSVAWMEWNTVIQAILWLPLILLSLDKIIYEGKKKFIWSMLFCVALASSFFAGHLQTFFYVAVVVFMHAGFEVVSSKRYRSIFFIGTAFVFFILFSAIQWIPTMQLILLSARNIDLNWQGEGWFIPWQHLVQFLVPDFFGNPATLNYWGVWNYGELIGYIGVVPLIFVSYALLFRRDRKTLFFSVLGVIAFLFAFQNPISQLPFSLKIPFISTAQPTRLLGIIDFAFAVLTAFGMDYFIKNQKKLLLPVGIVTAFFMTLWIFVLYGNSILLWVNSENIMIAKRNLIFPSITLGISVVIFLLSYISRGTRFIMMTCTMLVLLTIFDLFRFADKFIPFTESQYLFPNTKAITFLQKNIGNYRYMTTDSRIMAPNFSIMYQLQSIDGYDPLYLRSYGELIAASERGKPDISSPFGFNRIITPHNFDSKIIDLLGVRYVLSLSDISSSRLTKVIQEGETRIYENKNVFPRAFFVERVEYIRSKEEMIKKMLDPKIDLRRTAFVESNLNNAIALTAGVASITSYSKNKVTIKTTNEKDGFLVLTDSFYPTWKVTICCETFHDNLTGEAKDNIKSPAMIYRTDYNFRGVFVPKGEHIVEFENFLF